MTVYHRTLIAIIFIRTSKKKTCFLNFIFCIVHCSTQHTHWRATKDTVLLTVTSASSTVWLSLYSRRVGEGHGTYQGLLQCQRLLGNPAAEATKNWLMVLCVQCGLIYMYIHVYLIHNRRICICGKICEYNDIAASILCAYKHGAGHSTPWNRLICADCIPLL